MTCVKDILAKMDGLNKSRRDFMSALLATILALPGKMTFRNLSRFGPYCERSYGRHFSRAFDFVRFNSLLVQEQLGQDVIAAIDTSFIPKSGTKTFGIDRFFDPYVRKARHGLELSLIALIDVGARHAFTLSARQTPTFPAPSKKSQRMAYYIEQYQQALAYLPQRVRYIAADGAYACQAFIEAVRERERHLITRLRSDANLRWLYQGAQKGRGRPKRYDGKLDLKQPEHLEFVEELEPGIELYTALVNSPHFKCDLRIAYLLNRRHAEVSYMVLASTDVDLSAQRIVDYYRLRFQIEFLFRDGKQHAGLCDCQARDKHKLDFHFNAALSALNVARLQWIEKEHPVFSMASIKRISFNELFMDQLFLQLNLNPELLKLHPTYERLRSFGAIAA